MLELLFELDYALFKQINTIWTLPLLDFLLPYLRSKYFWAPLYLFISSYLLLNHPKKAWYILTAALLLILLTDQVSSQLIKPYFDRFRPCADTMWQDTVRILVPCGTGRSFTSSHAANHFGISTFLFLVFRRLSIPKAGWLWIWAVLVCYGQIYVGLHYPLDIFGGMFLGIITALITFKGLTKMLQNIPYN